MNTILTIIAVFIGIVHAVYVYRQEVEILRFRKTGRAFYYALWTLFLWVILGSHVVVYWLIALVPYFVARIMGKTVNASNIQTF